MPTVSCTSIEKETFSKTAAFWSLIKETSWKLTEPTMSWKFPDARFSAVSELADAKLPNSWESFFISPGNSTNDCAGRKIFPISIFTPMKRQQTSCRQTPSKHRQTVQQLSVYWYFLSKEKRESVDNSQNCGVSFLLKHIMKQTGVVSVGFQNLRSKGGYDYTSTSRRS